MRLDLNISLVEECNSWNCTIRSVSFLCIYLFLTSLNFIWLDNQWTCKKNAKRILLHNELQLQK